MSHVAWRVLRQIDETILVRFVAAIALRLEVWGPGSAFAMSIVDEMALPPGPRKRLLGEARGGAPVFDPRCLRWIIQEVAAVSASAAWDPSVRPPDGDDAFAVELLERVLFGGCLLARKAPSVRELLRAIWLLHEGYAHDTPEGASPLDTVLSITGSLGYGHRPRHAWLDRLSQWRRVWEVEDSHPSITNNPAAMGQAHRPSDLRRIFTEQTKLSIGDWMTSGLGVAARFFAWVANDEPHLAHPERIAEAVTDRGRLRPEVIAAIADHVVTSLAALGDRILAEMRENGWDYRGLGTTPTYDTRALAERPILLLSDDSAWAPLGLAMLVDRIVELPRALALESGQLGNSRAVGSLVGYMFEAAISDLISGLNHRHHVLTERDITRAVGRRQGGDGVIGYGRRYLIVEASVQTLGPHVAEGSPQAVRRRCADYHRKANQAEATAALLHEIAKFHGRPSPESAVSLVVADLPLTFNPAIAMQLRTQRPDRNPKFVCSLEEFEWLLELGDMGWEIPAAVMNWQARPADSPLSDQLEGLERIFGGDARWRFDMQAWLDAIPVEALQAA